MVTSLQRLEDSFMKKFEYKTIIVPCKQRVMWSYGNFNEDEFLSILQQHGNEGWELNQVLPYPHKKYVTDYLWLTITVYARLVFKREINS